MEESGVIEVWYSPCTQLSNLSDLLDLIAERLRGAKDESSSLRIDSVEVECYEGDEKREGLIRIYFLPPNANVFGLIYYLVEQQMLSSEGDVNSVIGFVKMERVELNHKPVTGVMGLARQVLDDKLGWDGLRHQPVGRFAHELLEDTLGGN